MNLSPHIVGITDRIAAGNTRTLYQAMERQDVGLSNSEKYTFQNNNGMVTSLMSRQEFYARHSRKYVDETFAGSLPAFLAAFTSEKKLTAQEITEIRELIDKTGVGNCDFLRDKRK